MFDSFDSGKIFFLSLEMFTKTAFKKELLNKTIKFKIMYKSVP